MPSHAAASHWQRLRLRLPAPVSACGRRRRAHCRAVASSVIAPPAAGALLVSFSIPVLLLPPLERGGAHRPRAATSRAGAPALAPPAPPPGWSPALLRFLAATIFSEHPGLLARCTFKAKLAPHSSVSSRTTAAAMLEAMPQDQVQGSPVAGQLGKPLGQEQCCQCSQPGLICIPSSLSITSTCGQLSSWPLTDVAVPQ